MWKCRPLSISLSHESHCLFVTTTGWLCESLLSPPSLSSISRLTSQNICGDVSEVCWLRKYNFFPSLKDIFVDDLVQLQQYLWLHSVLLERLGRRRCLPVTWFASLVLLILATRGQVQGLKINIDFGCVISASLIKHLFLQQYLSTNIHWIANLTLTMGVSYRIVRNF